MVHVWIAPHEEGLQNTFERARSSEKSNIGVSSRSVVITSPAKDTPPSSDHSNDIYSLACSLDGKRYTTTREERIVRVRVKGGLVLVYRGNSSEMYFVPRSSYESRTVSLSEDKTAQVQDTGTGRSNHHLGHINEVFTIAWSPDGQHLATVSVDKVAYVWDVMTGQLFEWA
jgi:WD40 repeat protein